MANPVADDGMPLADKYRIALVEQELCLLMEVVADLLGFSILKLAFDHGWIDFVPGKSLEDA